MVSMSKPSSGSEHQGLSTAATACSVDTPWCVDHDDESRPAIRCEGTVFTSGTHWGGVIGVGTLDDTGRAVLAVRLSVRSDSCKTPDGFRDLSVRAARDLVATLQLADQSGIELSTMESDALGVLTATLAQMDERNG